jgi:hypothetical protein
MRLYVVFNVLSFVRAGCTVTQEVPYHERSLNMVKLPTLPDSGGSENAWPGGVSAAEQNFSTNTSPAGGNLSERTGGWSTCTPRNTVYSPLQDTPAPDSGVRVTLCGHIQRPVMTVLLWDSTPTTSKEASTAKNSSLPGRICCSISQIRRRARFRLVLCSCRRF